MKNVLLTDVTHYWVFGCPSTYWYYISIWRLFSMLWFFCIIIWQTLQPITLCYFLYLAKDSLSHRQWQTDLNAGLDSRPRPLGCLNQAWKMWFFGKINFLLGKKVPSSGALASGGAKSIKSLDKILVKSSINRRMSRNCSSSDSFSIVLFP